MASYAFHSRPEAFLQSYWFSCIICSMYKNYFKKYYKNYRLLDEWSPLPGVIGRGGFNGRPLVQWPTRPLGGWALEAPGLPCKKFYVVTTPSGRHALVSTTSYSDIVTT